MQSNLLIYMYFYVIAGQWGIFLWSTVHNKSMKYLFHSVFGLHSNSPILKYCG